MTMSNRSVRIAFLVLAVVLASCSPTATPTVPPPAEEAPPLAPTETPSFPKEGILISEVLPGIPGVNNNLEFIELYNAGGYAVDLDGWSLWYRLHDQKDEELVHAWEGQADIPGHGHYLLVRTGQEVGNVGDSEYDLALFEKKGGLALREPEGLTVDTLVWGEGPSDYVTGTPAAAPDGGASLERLPGGEAGNGISTGEDAADFSLNPAPGPQNSGDPITPLPDKGLAIRLDIPESVEPGSEVSYEIEIENSTGKPVHDVRVLLPLPPGFEVISLPAGGSEKDGWVAWTLTKLSHGGTERGTILLQSPWTYLSTLLRGAYVEAVDWETRAYGPVAPLSVEGGAIPIATARTLKGKTVTVEGVANMYTGGFYAGSTGTKFYLEDETGGLQAYCPGGKDLVEVAVGDQVRVTGLIEVYRDSIEIIPATYPDDVEMLEQGGPEPEAMLVTLEAASGDESVLGRLIEVEGTATRIEEFTYSYEVDLMDDEGHILLVYIEKDTGVTTEPLDAGSLYRVTGISELYIGQWQIKPRFQSDMVEIFPPELMLDMQAPNSAIRGETVTYTLTVHNHTSSTLTDVRVEAARPTEGVPVVKVLDGGELEGDTVVWTIPELAGGGESATVRYLVTVNEEASGQFVAEGAVTSAKEWPNPVVTDPLLTFVGSGVPIWAIQGSGHASPYVRDQASTEGIVIGVFPELGGFWIQEAETDDDNATSAGLFVLAEELEIPVALGDLVQISGKVRERSGQTMLEIFGLDDVTIVSQGNELPLAVELDPPIDEEEAQAYYEALEGALVQVTDPALVVGPTTKYGETVLVRSEWGIERVMRGDPTGMLIFVDDGSDTTHLDRTTLPFALQTGDTAAGITGPLAYTYEQYKIEPITAPAITSTEQPVPRLEPVGPDQFSIATFNVENLFDPSTPHPDDPPIPSTREYKLDLAKTANAIVAMGSPTIVGLQEVENIDVMADLAEEEAIAQYNYEPVLIEGTDSRGIDVAYLVRGDQATLEGAASYAAPEGLTSRPPLLITTTVHLDSGYTTVYVLNNHFTSMSGGEKPTEPRRKAQAAWNATLVEQILASDPGAHIVVLGDLNSFYDSPPLDVLREAGLRHVYEFVEPERPYSYIYQGESETLDHILLTPALYELLTQVEAVHMNADYPLPLPGDASARGVSDHDPLVVVFSLQ
jgi:predicted extracellular nuclease